jgi:S1-C subfamily serine protease
MKVESKGDQGLVVTNIEENSLAAQAGLRPNDRIIFVDGRPFTHGRQLDAYLAGHGGRRVPVIIDRSGQRLTVYMTPAQLASDTAWLGVYLEEGESNATGARITQVYPSGPAARAGLQPGDTITQIDDRRIEHPADLISRVQELEPQTQSQLVIVRANRELKVPVTLGSRETFVHSQQASYGNENSQPPVENEQAQNANGPSEFDDVPEHAMGLEQDRRNAEQHQRIEHEIQLLREEIRQLREELKKK